MPLNLYSDEVVSTICEGIARGASLVEICRADNLPSETTVYRWLAEKPVFREMYAHARETAAERFADEMIRIADSVRHAKSQAEVQAAKLAIDTRKWIASKHAPKKYGDKIETENRTTVATDDPLTALMKRIGSEGRKIYDPQPK
jgi:hypothetical protein